MAISIYLGSAALAKPSLAYGQDGPHVGFSLAPLLFSDNEAGNATVEFDTGIGFGALIGYKLANLRLLGELAYRTVEGTSTTDVNADINIMRFTGAAYYDFGQWALRPYVGGGMGIASLDSSGDFDDEDNAFTWHAETGLTINLTDQFAILPAYRYEWTDTDLGRFDEALTSHAFRVTLRYQFSSASRRVKRGSYWNEPTSPYLYPRRYEYDPIYRYDPYYYDPYYPRPRPHHPKPSKTPEQIERDRCGWEGPGCPPSKQNWED